MITKQGVVVKKIGDITLKVEVHQYLVHPKYKKRFRQTKLFLVHDPEQKGAVGAEVSIKQCRPVSKRKHWVLQSNLTSTQK